MTALIFLAVVLFTGLLLIQFSAWYNARSIMGRALPNCSQLNKDSESHGEHCPIKEWPEQGLIYFHGPGCSACKPMTPIIDELINQKRPVYKINIRDHPRIAIHLGVMGTPTLIQFKQGQITDVRVGKVGNKQIQLMVDAISPQPT